MGCSFIYSNEPEWNLPERNGIMEKRNGTLVRLVYIGNRTREELSEVEKAFTYEELVSGTIESYQVLESMYDLVNLTNGLAYERTMEQFSNQQRLIFAVDSYISEVYNGGHEQFFFNSTGVVWRDALEGLEAMGAQEAVLILKRAVGRFFCEIPDDADARRKLMYDIEEELFEEDDQDFYNMSVDLNKLEKTYIKQNAEAFI